MGLCVQVLCVLRCDVSGYSQHSDPISYLLGSLPVKCVCVCKSTYVKIKFIHKLNKIQVKSVSTRQQNKSKEIYEEKEVQGELQSTEH